MPSIASLAALQRAADEFPVTRLDLLIEPAARAAARESVQEAGLLLLGEVHGVRENPLLIRALLLAFGLEGLALEWHRDLAPVIGGFLAGQPLADHPLLWLGDGRITTGHLAVLRERTAACPLALAMFDGTADAGWDWSRHDAAMAARVLAGAAAGTLVVAGNAHTPVRRTRLGLPMGAVLAQDRPGVREIRVRYGGGHFYNSTPAGSAAASGRGGTGPGCTSGAAPCCSTCQRPRKPSSRNGRCPAPGGSPTGPALLPRQRRAGRPPLSGELRPPAWHQLTA